MEKRNNSLQVLQTGAGLQMDDQLDYQQDHHLGHPFLWQQRYPLLQDEDHGTHIHGKISCPIYSTPSCWLLYYR